MGLSHTHVLKLRGTALSDGAALMCDHPRELVLWAKDRVAHRLLSSVQKASEIELQKLLAEVSAELSTAFGGRYVVDLVDYDTEDSIDCITDAEDIVLFVDCAEDPLTTEYH